MRSTSLNPLSEVNTINLKHMIIAFQNSEDAYSYDYSKAVNLEIGTYVTGKSGQKGIVILNEHADANIVLTDANTVWKFFDSDYTTSSYYGQIHLRDISNFYLTDFFHNVNKKMGMSLNFLTFAWCTTFFGLRENKEPISITPNPMFFMVSNFSSNNTVDLSSYYVLNIVSCYNTFGRSPSFSKTNQITISKREKNSINSTISVKNVDNKLKPVIEKHKQFKKMREEILSESKKMKTIGEMFTALENSLNASTKPHRKQFQSFMSIIRNDKQYGGYYDIKQKDDDIKISYKINYSDYFKDKVIDNINIEYESMNISNSYSGVYSVTFPNGYSINKIIYDIIKMSSSFGDDHFKEDNKKSYKVTISSFVDKENTMELLISINDYIVPNNSVDKNTGPGNNLVTGDIIEYSYQDYRPFENLDVTVSSVTFSIKPPVNLNIDYQITNDNKNNSGYTLYGVKEPINVLRKTDGKSFFQYGLSGLPSWFNTMLDSGYVNPVKSKYIDILNPTQQSSITLSVLGNPDLLNDINRNPIDIKNKKPGNCKIYKNVEYDPMYLKIRVYLYGKLEKIGSSTKYYMDNYIHIYKIENSFSNGYFKQTIHCGMTTGDF